MRANRTLIMLCWLAATGVAMITSPVSHAQDQLTATPDAEGLIYAEVEPNDSLWGIASRAGISLQELLALNQLGEDAIIHPGDRLIIGQVPPPATATIEPATATPTNTRSPPTPTRTPAPPPRTALCFVAFDDLNRDGIRDIGEPLRPAVAFTIFDDETVVGNYITDGLSEPFCLEWMVPGDYKVTRSVGRNERLTTAGDWVLALNGGSVLNLEFGSYTEDPISNRTIATIPPASNGTPGNDTTSGADSGAELESGDRPADLLLLSIVVLGLFLGGGLLLVARARRA
jgi:hypothetical protein